MAYKKGKTTKKKNGNGNGTGGQLSVRITQKPLTATQLATAAGHMARKMSSTIKFLSK